VRRLRLSLLVLCACAFARTASAEREVTIRDYSDEVRARVLAKVAEALGGASERQAEISGVVTFADASRFFLQRGDDGLKVVANGRALGLAPGDVVSVSGEPSLEGGRIVLRGRAVSKTGREPLPEAREATAADLVETDRGRPSVNWLRVTVEGRVLGFVENGFAVDVSGVPVNVCCADVPDFLSDAPRTHPVVRVTGVAELLLDQSVLLGRDSYVMGVKLDAAGADVEILPDLAYYAAQRSRRIVHVAASVCAVLAVLLAGIGGFSLRQRRRLLLSRTVMAERKRMADDLHDTIEQHLVGAGMFLKLGRLKEADAILVRAKREIRDIVWGLKNDDMMRQSPAEMLRQLAHDENTKGLCRVDTKLAGLPAQMDAAKMRDLSLVVREAIGNAIKHGGAKKVAITADAAEGGGWRLRVANDGAPFDPAKAPGAAEGHFGLEGMRQRARRIGADVAFERRGDWTVVCLTSARPPCQRPDVV
jgi:signal transduction histidine kinase